MKRLIPAVALLLYLISVKAYGQGILPYVEGTFTANNGTPLNLGKICTTVSGAATNLPSYPTYADAVAGTNANANPVVLDAFGRANIWLRGGTAYRITIYPATGTGFTCNGSAVGTAIKTIDGITTGISIINALTINGTQMCDQYPGSTAGAKIAACVAALPVTGGRADATGLQGAQTISSTISIGKPVELLLGASTFTVTTTAFNVTAFLHIEGIGKTGTTINTTCLTCNVFTVASDAPFIAKNFTVSSVGQTSGAFFSLTGALGSNTQSIIEDVTLARPYVGIDLGVVNTTRIRGNTFTAIEYRGIRCENTSNADEGDIEINSHNVFGGDTAKADTAAIELRGCAGIKIQQNKFYAHKYGVLEMWNSNTSTGQLLIEDNNFESHTTAVISLQRVAGKTGSLGGPTIVGNYMRADTAGATNGTLIDVPTDGAATPIAALTIVGNSMFPGDVATAINFGNNVGGGSFIDSNLIRCGGGTSKGIVVGTGITEIEIGLNNILCTTGFTIGSTLRGLYTPDKLAVGGVSPGVTLNSSLNVPNNDALAGFTSGGVAKRIAGISAGDVMQYDQDGIGAQFGNYLIASTMLVSATTNAFTFTNTFNTFLNRPPPAAQRTITINDALASSQMMQDITAADNAVDLALVATGACTAARGIGVTGARFGDQAGITAATNLQDGTFLVARVSAADTVAWQFCNLSGGNVDRASDNYTVQVFKH